MKPTKELEIQIDGGLGNQLFQFYAGLYFSQKFEVEPKFDISRLHLISKVHPGENIYTLGLLDSFATKQTNFLFGKKFTLRAKNYYSQRVSRSGSKVPLAAANQNFGEIGFIENEDAININRPISGYYQTWRYFDALQNKPKLSYERLINPSSWLNQSIQKIHETEPFVMHVRRGDYQLSKNKQIGCLSLDYFKSVCEKHVGNKEIWMFTDSPKIVREEFRNFGSKIHFLEPPKNSDPVESMILMSNADSIAISNSTFSWWAAKLASSDTKVFVPQKWFQGRPDPLDLIPNSWIKIKSDWDKYANPSF